MRWSAIGAGCVQCGRESFEIKSEMPRLYSATGCAQEPAPHELGLEPSGTEPEKMLATALAEKF